MRILVTGGMGEVGRPMVQWLLDKGHEVRVLDLTNEPPIDGADCRTGTVVNFAELHEHMAGMEGVIHLAGHRHPGRAPGTEIFHVNVEGTFNIFRAAADAGIKRVVCASSINALGYNFGIKFPEGQLKYFPIDEDHPEFTTDPYSLSKQMMEDIGGYFWRREGITSLFLRMPAVHDPTGARKAEFDMNSMAAISRDQTAKVMNMPEPQRSRRVQELIAMHRGLAEARTWEAQINYGDHPDIQAMMEMFAIMFGRTNFWTLLDARDAALAAELGLTADYEGSHAVYITDPENYLGTSTRELAAVWFPEVTTWKRLLSGAETLVSIDRLRELTGYEGMYPYGREE